MTDLPVERIVALIERQGTLEQASNFLRRKGTEHSAGSWADMREKRLLPALKEGKLSADDLLELLAEVEEHGRQHVFLYRLRKGRTISHLFQDGNLETIATADPKLPSVGSRSFQDMPDEPTILELRRESKFGSGQVVLKIVEKRDKLANPVEREENGRLVVTWERDDYRAVNMVRIWSSGMMEMRIYSHQDAVSYAADATVLWGRIKSVVAEDDWVPMALDELKQALWDVDQRDAIKDLYLVKTSNHKNNLGGRIAAAAGVVGTSMLDDPRLAASVDEFNASKDDAFCEKATVAVRKQASNGIMSRDLNVILHGEVNELTITSKVSETEYEFILQKVLEGSKAAQVDEKSSVG